VCVCARVLNRLESVEDKVIVRVRNVADARSVWDVGKAPHELALRERIRMYHAHKCTWSATYRTNRCADG
jgi:hypothetical protein